MSKSLGEHGIRGLYQKRGWFYYQPPKPRDGKPRGRAVALKTQDLISALQAMREHQEGLDLERTVVSGTLAEVLPRYYAAKREDTGATRRARRVILEQFMRDTGNPLADALTAGMIDDWRAHLMERKGRSGKPLSGTTIKSYTITLRAFVNWLRQERILRHDPMARLKKQTRLAGPRWHEFLTGEQRDRLLGVEDMPETVRLILLLGFYAGLRHAEMLALTPDWIWISPDGQRGMLTVQETPVVQTDGRAWVWRPKTRQMRTIPLHPRLLEFLRSYGMKRPFLLAPEKAQWPAQEMNSKRHDAKKSLHALAQRTKVPKLNYHIMRHSFATHLAMKGVTLAEIAGMLGDSLKVTEDRYAGFCPNEGNALEVL